MKKRGDYFTRKGPRVVKPRGWWNLYPDRLDFELAALIDAGFKVERDDEFEVRTGVLRLRLFKGDEEYLVWFPDLYPFFRFEIVAPKLDLPKHQNPLGKNLCLIGRRTDNWSTRDTVAGYLETQLPKLLDSVARSSGDTSELEELQGEPAVTYLPYLADGGYLIDTAWDLRSEVSGTFQVGLPPGGQPHRGAVVAIVSRKGKTLARAEASISTRYPHLIRGRWVRLDRPLIRADARSFLDELAKTYPEIATPLVNTVKVGGREFQVQIVGGVFRDELKYRVEGDSWAFVIRVSSIDVGGAGQRRANKPTDEVHFVRALRFGDSDRAVRFPPYSTLQTKSVTVIGAGALGAASVLEFARAGVGAIRVVDHDFVDPATSIRWPLGLSVAGLPKGLALGTYLSSEYPHVKFSSTIARIGEVRFDVSAGSQQPTVAEALKGADLVYDATAEPGVSYFLSEHCLRSRVPLVVISATEGAWGGRVVRILPREESGCWYCFRLHIEDETIPIPPGDGGLAVQPAGCADPTFTGSGFDLASIAMAGVRMGVSTLCSGAGYPATSWDVEVVSLRDDSGALSPRTQTFVLNRHPRCPACAGRESG